VDLIETLRSTGAVREFTDDPVGDDVVARILDTARFAPSGGNAQAWHVVVIKDPGLRVRLRDLYVPSRCHGALCGGADAGRRVMPLSASRRGAPWRRGSTRTVGMASLASRSAGGHRNTKIIAGK
jgi:nitroreductase